MSSQHEPTRRRALELIAAGSVAGTIPNTALAQTSPRSPAASGDEVDLNLVLAVDASGSVNQVRFELQKQGYVTAFANRQVLAAIRSGPHAAIGVTMFQWTGPSMQAPVVLWSRISNETSIDRLAGAIAAAPRVLFSGGTSVSGAIDFGVTVLGNSPFKGGRRVIDISGDGANNRGRSADSARDAAIENNVNINGLPILEVEPDLEVYYRNNVIGGPGAFVISAATFADFGEAIRRKLIQEIAQGAPHLPTGRPQVPT
jgi:Protein of unknown function (DUF1194)